MALELRQQLKLTQQLVMTPQLQMAIRLLQLSRLELVETIRQEMEENPALEESQDDLGMEEFAGDAADEAPAEVAEVAEREVTVQEKLGEEVDWSNYLDEYNTPGRITHESEEREAPRYESFIAKKETLSDHLLWQLLMTNPTEVEERVGSLLIGNLDRNGFLDLSLEDIAEAAGVDIVLVEAMLERLQGFDPVGVCARDLRECLLIQARHYRMDDEVVVAIIDRHLGHLENRNLKAIARDLKVPTEEILRAINVIKGLEPRPGREFTDETPHYITPDIYVHKVDDEYVIVLNDDGMPRLRVNSFYQDAMSRGNGLVGPAREYMQEKIRSAAWLIKSIHQRQKTICRVMESILKHQREFFEKGVAYLRPMILKDVAEDIEMHESTISRVTTNKYVHTPQGIFELKFFFNSSINRDYGDAVASVSVQDKIRKIIESEDSEKPYSDDKIALMLKEDGNIQIARRTVAKYREMMRILPSNKRKHF